MTYNLIPLEKSRYNDFRPFTITIRKTLKGWMSLIIGALCLFLRQKKAIRDLYYSAKLCKSPEVLLQTVFNQSYLGITYN